MRSSFSKLTQSNKTIDLKEITDDLFRLKENAAKVEATNKEKFRREASEAADKINKQVRVGTSGGFLG